MRQSIYNVFLDNVVYSVTGTFEAAEDRRMLVEVYRHFTDHPKSKRILVYAIIVDLLKDCEAQWELIKSAIYRTHAKYIENRTSTAEGQSAEPPAFQN